MSGLVESESVGVYIVRRVRGLAHADLRAPRNTCARDTLNAHHDTVARKALLISRRPFDSIKVI